MKHSIRGHHTQKCGYQPSDGARAEGGGAPFIDHIHGKSGHHFISQSLTSLVIQHF